MFRKKMCYYTWLRPRGLRLRVSGLFVLVQGLGLEGLAFWIEGVLWLGCPTWAAGVSGSTAQGFCGLSRR